MPSKITSNRVFSWEGAQGKQKVARGSPREATSRQHETKIILAIKISLKYNPKTVNILNKKPKAANTIENFKRLILLFRLIN